MNNITFIGGGNMAYAIIGGLLARATPPQSLHVVDVMAEARNRIRDQYPGVSCFEDARQAIRDEDIIVLAVKPQQLRDAVAGMVLSENAHLVISIAAGVSLSTLSRWCKGCTRIVRAMPNTPALVGEGVTALYAVPGTVSEADRATAQRILAAVGQALWLTNSSHGEDLMNAVTAISGSGPAYVFLFMEAMEQAAAELHLPPAMAKTLIMQTFLGAARLAAASDEAVSVLRQRVTSKGGTTEAALSSMEGDQVKAAIVSAILAANRRGRELGALLDRE